MKTQFYSNLRFFRLVTQCVVLLSAVVFLSPLATAADKAKPKVVAQQSVVSINKASAEAIAASLNGVGINKAQAIVDWRKKNGAFKRVEQLLEVKGIGEKTLDRNRSRISL